VRVSLRVAAPQAVAFRVFTEGIDGWWRHGKKYRIAEPSVMHLSPGLGGRLTETVTRGGKTRTFEIGRVTTWDPPRRLVMTWRAVNFRESDPDTEVEVTFERALGHSGEGTLVTLEHRGFSRVRDDHPVRHGQPPRAFIAAHARWWGDLAAALQLHIASGRETAPGPERA
jgi:uncharacterized protein YndB with AHSA1/START domain